MEKAKQGRRWTADEDALVIAQAVPDAVLARAINRSLESVTYRRYILETRNRRDDEVEEGKYEKAVINRETWKEYKRDLRRWKAELAE